MSSSVRDWTVRINGTEYPLWETLRLGMAIDQLAHTFAVSLYDGWVAKEEDVPFQEGDPIVLLWKGTEALTGYVDRVSISYSSTGHTLSAEGRSKTGDLVDCAAVVSPGEWAKADILKIATDITGPFGIGAGNYTDIGTPVRKFAVQEGETAAESLERLARTRGVLATCDAFGDVRFARAGQDRASTKLQYGVNILTGSREGSATERFSEYTLKSQVSGDDSFFGEKAATPMGTATDDLVTRYRPLVVLSECQESGAELKKRAEWERTVRAGRARRLSYRVQGCEHLDGYLWVPNLLVQVDDPRLRVQGDYLVAEVAITASQAYGTVTDLTLMSPKAFTVEPIPKPKQKGGFLPWL